MSDDAREPRETPLQQSSNLLATILVGGGFVAAALGALMAVLDGAAGRWALSGGARGSLLIALGALVFLVMPGWFLKQRMVRHATAARARGKEACAQSGDAGFTAKRRLVHSPTVERVAGGVLALGFVAGGVGLLLAPGLGLEAGLIATAIALGLAFLLLRAIEEGIANTVVGLARVRDDGGGDVLVIDFWGGGRVRLERADVKSVERGTWTASRGPAAAGFVKVCMAHGVGRGYRALIVLREPWDVPFDTLAGVVERWHGGGDGIG